VQLSRITHDPSLFGAYSQVCPTFVHFCGALEGAGPSLREGQPASSSARADAASRAWGRGSIESLERSGPMARRLAKVTSAAPAARTAGMNFPLVALAALKDISEDGSTDPGRTLMGALALLVIIAVVIGIGQMMTGGERTSR
jgi:hypothetical protein